MRYVLFGIPVKVKINRDQQCDAGQNYVSCLEEFLEQLAMHSLATESIAREGIAMGGSM